MAHYNARVTRSGGGRGGRKPSQRVEADILFLSGTGRRKPVKNLNYKL